MSTARKNPDNVETVDSTRHRTLRVKMDSGFDHAKAQHIAPVTLAELAATASSYPVVFIKRPADGTFMMVAMMGLRSGENAYHAPEFWESTYVPLAVQRGPFLIGYDDRRPEADEITACIDTTSPYLSETDGIALFDANGQQTDFMQSRHQMLGTIFESQKVTDAFSKTMNELGLIVPMTLQLRMQNGDVRNVAGLFTLDEAKIKQLSADQLKSLHESDYLAPCYLTLASLHQLKQLIRLRNRKGGDQITNFQIDFNAETPAAQ